MAIIISISNQKGGVGKSTTAQALSDCLGVRRKKVLLIDLDAQGNTSLSSGAKPISQTLFTVLDGDHTAEEAIQHTKYYDLLPSDPKLVNVELAQNVAPGLLEDAIEAIKSRYDFIIIDTGPSLGRLLFTALAASDFVIIPAIADAYSLQGLSALNETIINVRKLNSNLRVMGILLTKHNSRTVLSRDVQDMISKYANAIGTTLFDHSIREGIAVKEAQLLQKPLIDYRPSAKPTLDYIGFTSEVIERSIN